MGGEKKRTGACFPEGFKASGVSAGIKESGDKDVSLLFSDAPAVSAGVFTKNLVAASPVLVSRKHLEMSPESQAIVFSSGNANAATGKQGYEVSMAMCEAAANALNIEPKTVLIAQTGLIGIKLNKEIAVSGVIKAASELSELNGTMAASAMMTTDTHPKESTKEFQLEGQTIKVGGMAKGAAMLSPAMATMLAVVTTDAKVTPEVANLVLKQAMDKSFHSMIVDGCMSTNDTVFLMANGMSGAGEISTTDSPGYNELLEAVTYVAQDLAKQMAKDGEGSTKFLTMKVKGAKTEEDAMLAAKAVVGSTLVKCSLAGEGQYWGRVISELGASGASFNPDDVEIYYGEHKVCSGGLSCSHDEVAVDALMKEVDITITAHLGAGNASWEAYGCDLTHDYLIENMGRS